MLKNVKKKFMAGILASLFVIPTVVSASAPIGAGTPMLPSVIAPSALGNYMKGDKNNQGDILGLARGYEIMPLSKLGSISSAALGEDTEMNGMWMESTAYSPYETSGYTATGVPVRYGIAAVDSDLIPLGTNLYVEGYGQALAADTGGAIRGNRIDLAFDTHQEALNWGRRDVLVKVM